MSLNPKVTWHLGNRHRSQSKSRNQSIQADGELEQWLDDTGVQGVKKIKHLLYTCALSVWAEMY